MKLDDLFFKLVPLATGFFIIAGVLYATCYYYVFNLNVLQYLEFSEIVVLFLYHILYGVIIIVSAIYSALHDRNIQCAQTEKRKKATLGVTLFLIIALAITLLLIYANWQSAVAMLFLFGLLFVFVRLINSFRKNLSEVYEKVYGIPFRKIYDTSIFFSMIYLSAIILIAFGNGALTKLYPDWSSTYKIILKDSTSISTNDSLIYIGRSRNYTFLYNQNSNEKTILSNDEISSIKIK